MLNRPKPLKEINKLLACWLSVQRCYQQKILFSAIRYKLLCRTVPKVPHQFQNVFVKFVMTPAIE